MKSPHKIVISVSRRTDIPAFYMPWFMNRIEKGSFGVPNPYNRKVSIVPAAPDKVHTIVFWSKNFGPFIDARHGERLQKQGYNLFFNFTINSENAILEPQVPPIKNRLDQLAHLCDRFGPEAIQWRFDPICFFETGNGIIENNLQDFAQIAEKAAQSGITRCITSFMDDYPKIRKRTASMPGFAFTDIPIDQQKEIALRMEHVLSPIDICLFVCCERELLAALPVDSTISQSACIPNDFLVKLYGGNLSLKKDTGQRAKAGCGCKVSVDIGSYQQHACYHSCLFCYANPATKQKPSEKYV